MSVLSGQVFSLQDGMNDTPKRCSAKLDLQPIMILLQTIKAVYNGDCPRLMRTEACIRNQSHIIIIISCSIKPQTFGQKPPVLKQARWYLLNCFSCMPYLLNQFPWQYICLYILWIQCQHQTAAASHRGKSNCNMLKFWSRREKKKKDLIIPQIYISKTSLVHYSRKQSVLDNQPKNIYKIIDLHKALISSFLSLKNPNYQVPRKILVCKSLFQMRHFLQH